MKNLRRVFVILAAFHVLANGQDAPQVVDPTIKNALAGINRKFEGDSMEAANPLNAFRSNFKAALVKYGEAAQSSGNLEGVLASRKAVEDFDAGKPVVGDAKDKGLLALQKTYISQLTIQKAAVDAQFRVAKKKRIDALEELVRTLTKQGRIEDAMGVRAEIEGVEFFGTKWSFRNKDEEIAVCRMLPGGKVDSTAHPAATWSPIDSNSLRYSYAPDGDHIIFRYDDREKERMSGHISSSKRARFLYPLPK